jgi:SPP1 gp7 family putative phage head morphogenesis protein
LASLDPRQLEFWSAEERRLWDEIAPTILTVMFEGARAGTEALPKGLQVLVDWDWVNEDVIRFLYEYRLGILAKVNETTRTRTVQAIDEWIRSGERLDMLSKRLEPIYGKSRARRIAVTEITRYYAEGNVSAWRSTRLVSGKQWRTAADELVCPICRPLNNKIVGLNDDGFTTETGGIGLFAPPAHPNCRCWLQPVVSDELLRDAIRQELDR